MLICLIFEESVAEASVHALLRGTKHAWGVPSVAVRATLLVSLAGRPMTKGFDANSVRRAAFTREPVSLTCSCCAVIACVVLA